MQDRFIDNDNGTVTDNTLKLIWRKTDSFQDTQKWMNWFKGQDYIEIANIERLGVYENCVTPNKMRHGLFSISSLRIPISMETKFIYLLYLNREVQEPLGLTKKKILQHL